MESALYGLVEETAVPYFVSGNRHHVCSLTADEISVAVRRLDGRRDRLPEFRWVLTIEDGQVVRHCRADAWEVGR